MKTKTDSHKSKDINVDKSQGIIAKIKGIKNIEIIIAVISVVVMLVIYFGSSFSSNEVSIVSVKSELEDYCTKMETDLVDSLSSVSGAGNVKVVINWDSSVEQIIAYITSSSGDSYSSSPQIVTVDGNGVPIILKELYPKAIGVIIICQGGDNIEIKLSIIEAVSNLLDISASNVNVLTMQN